MIQIKELVFNPAKGYDEFQPFATLDYDPQAYGTQEDAAKGLYEALRKVAAEKGQNPDIEVSIWAPGENGPSWRVSWEAGPYDWAIPVSFKVTGPWGFTEPYYGFDLCFTD